MMFIAHRKNVLCTDRQVWDTVTNLLSGGGGYAHSELVFSDGLAFTSTTKSGDRSGPTWLRRDYPATMWSLTPVPATPEQEAIVRAWCELTLAESIRDKGGYDWAGVCRFVFPFLKEHKKDWFCSEIVVAALQQIGWFTDREPWRISPNKLFLLCKAGNLS